MAKHSLACALLLGASLSAQDVPALPAYATDGTNLQAWRTHIRPNDKDLTFEIIPWLTTLADGIRAADEESKPLLLWVMNGHPLGCT
jgi:hypothetical protein